MNEREELDHRIALGFTYTLCTADEYQEVLQQHIKSGCKFCEREQGSGDGK
jgi:hypothetical protein